ncbi:MAG: AsmA-like C-terminal region-containing protein [Chitinophagaceae bacterium]
MKNKVRLVFRVLAWITAIFIALWLLVWGYVIINKKSLLAQVNAELTRKVKGEIKIGDIEPSLLSTFPNVSIRLSNVIVRDTLWKVHHHDLLKADKIFIRLKLYSLFSGNPVISKVIIEKGAFFIFADTSGYSNEYMFQSEKSGGGETGTSKSSVPDIELNQVTLTLDLKDRDKLFDFAINRLRCDIKTHGDELRLNVSINLVVHSLAFNTDRGSFVKEKPLKGKFTLDFDRVKKKLSFEDVRMRIDNHPFTFSGKFDFTSKPPLYYLAIKTEKILYKQASLLVSNNISQRLDSFNIEKPIDVSVVIDGTTLPNKMPLINLDVKIKDNNVTTPFANFTDVSVMGHFDNLVTDSKPKSDENSGFRFTGISAKWENIPLTSDTLTIENLGHPVLNCDLHSSFDLAELNDVIGINTIEFSKGSCKADLKVRSALMKSDTTSASIFGTVYMEESSLQYIPRNLLFTQCSGKLVFNDKDFYVKQLKAHIGNSDLVMNGAVKNLTSLIDRSPEKLIFNWNIASPKIVLSDFITFLDNGSAKVPKKASTKKIVKMANRIDRMLNDCNVDLQINADQLIYKKFVSGKVAANLQLTDKMLSLKKVLIEHAGGTLLLNGSLTDGANQNLIRLNATMNDVDVTKVFTAFNNFGQDGIIDKNLKGRLSADIVFSGIISSKAEIDPNSLKGIIDLKLKNGELIDFEPVKKISQTAFKSRDFSNIRFAELIEKLEINGSEIKVNRMEIQSTVMTMFVEGIYDVKKGTDLSIQIPLSNLSKRGEDFKLKNKGVRSKTGMSILLRAKTGEDGKAKISWDPFKLALKKKNKLTESDTPSSDSTKVKSRRRRG